MSTEHPEEKKDSAEDLLRKRTQKSWISERVAELFRERGFDSTLEDGMDLIRKRRVLDFTVVSGSFGARVFGEEGPPTKIEIRVDQLSSSQWSRVFSVLSERAYYLAKLLAGELPEEITAAFTKADADLFPWGEIVFYADDQPFSEMTDAFAAVVYRLCDKLVADPFLLFTLLGRGREETILELRKRRSALKAAAQVPEISPSAVEEELPPPIEVSSSFWESSDDLAKLHYNIKADELPAAILKWLDPPPLVGLEVEAESALEEAYEIITRRAQAYGLGMLK